MKQLIHSTLALLILASGVYAAEGHDHDKVIPGPKGGRIVEVEGGHAEFFVQPDKKVSITFYDKDMKVVPAGEQVVAAIAEAPTGKVKLEFEESGDSLVSTSALPEGDGYRIVLQVKANAQAKPQNLRIEYHTEVCGKCNRAEYACICEGEKDGHGH
ncbi:MAG: hypothetical protein BGO12_00965 [Verrucomicrobia bacterium 61-8]|jgi:hypothetical protein|nr:hypothetical protein [Verrucomicrobiota bacterium]OJU97949.1 MAG: hypothetical protein BGO12_00965 [Verrucomicrobia bacterium 61-8]